MFPTRASGILLHPTCFPSRYGIGDLGQEAFDFVQFLYESDQRWWQILPLGPTSFGDSPYLSYSALAGNPLLISPDKLREVGLLSDSDLAYIPDFPLDSVNFDWVKEVKHPLYETACQNFHQNPPAALKTKFSAFCDRNQDWLDDYALFMAIKEAQGGSAWYDWPTDLKWRKPLTLVKAKTELKDRLFYHQFLQFCFFEQWLALRQYANDRHILIFGDIPIYVAHDSVDVWGHPEIFHLDPETGDATLKAGVPPDYFSETGQLWGNPVYNWEAIQKENYQWWFSRFKGVLKLVDVVRIDHFRGFEAFWAVPGEEETAMNGSWLPAPGDEFFTALQKDLGELPIVAEDLGVITPEVEALRDKFEFPGMKLLHFAFDDNRANPFLPFNYPRNCVAYTGTHDNNTTVGWFTERDEYAQQRVLDFIGGVDSWGVHWSLIRLAMSSVANQAIFPFQDILGLGADARMNTPSSPEGNWGWRFRKEALNPEMRDRLRYLTYLYGRQPVNETPIPSEETAEESETPAADLPQAS
ncbi:MAG: 4-alpha-glucanotransferase [Cyanobacteria bacterium P01_H01_bin.15]